MQFMNTETLNSLSIVQEEPVRRALLEFRQRLVELYGARLFNVLLFGSYARGEAQPGSDIDVLIALEGDVAAGQEISRVSPIMAALSLLNDVVISCTFVSQERWQHGRSPLLLNARAEGIPL
jgi:uncharacterized protein